MQGTIAPHSMPSIQGSSECSEFEPARLERPMWQLQAVIMPWMHYAIRQQISCSIADSELPQMPCGLGSCCMSMGISPLTISITCTGSGSKLQSLVTYSSNRDHQ